MQLLLSLVWFLLAIAAPCSGRSLGKRADTNAADLEIRSGLPDLLVPENQCISTFYHDDAKKNMCKESTYLDVLGNHCKDGTASLVSDCDALKQDLQGKDGGGFWGYSDESATGVIVASHDTCSFNLTAQHSTLFNIGTQDLIDLIDLSLASKGKCGNDEMVAVTGDVWCKYKGNSIDTRWYLNGPSKICGGGGR